MKTWLQEKIGNPELFTGRKKELNYFLQWIGRIKREISPSMAILSRRKTGKTALLQRLFNVIFEKNDGVIPFYFEIRETDRWIGDFAENFFLSFLYQYIAFKTRNPEYLSPMRSGTLEQAYEISVKQGFDFLKDPIRSMQIRSEKEQGDLMWDIARELPRGIAEHTNEKVVQFIDEFQFLNRFIFRDKSCRDRIDNLAGSYLHTCEYKNAPILAAGSWVGWLTRDLLRLLPGRFLFHYFEGLPEEEAVEMILKYSHTENLPVTEEIVPLMAELTEGNPFYISSLFRSKYGGKDFTAQKGLLETLEFETLHREGSIKGTWMEYVSYALKETNDLHAKKIVLYLSKHREREVTRDEIRKNLHPAMTDAELEKKLKILVLADIIEQGSSNFDYRGVPDNIFDKVFRGVYQKEIETFDSGEITAEYKALSEKLLKKIRQLRGEYGRYKGAFAEFVIIERLRHEVCRNNDLLKSGVQNLPDDFAFTEYGRIWGYHSPPLHEPEFQIDIFAKADEDKYSLIWEVKNRKAKFTVKEAEEFVKKADELKKLENTGKSVLIVFSAHGFLKNTLVYLKKQGIAWTEDKRWLERNK